MNTLINTSQDNGFTLIEILMVIVLVAIIASVGSAVFIDFSDDARKSVTTERLTQLKSAISGDARLKSGGRYLKPGFENDIGNLPTSLDDLIQQGSFTNYNPFSKRGWRGPYVNKNVSGWNLDAWGNALIYDSTARTLTSYGKDNAPGGSDDIVINF